MLNDFVGICFPNNGIPDLCLLIIHLMYGPKAMKFYLEKSLYITDCVYFENVSLYGLCLRRDITKDLMGKEFLSRAVESIKNFYS